MLMLSTSSWMAALPLHTAYDKGLWESCRTDFFEGITEPQRDRKEKEPERRGKKMGRRWEEDGKKWGRY